MSRTNVFPETAHSMARGLGWFSIGLGLAELLAPRTLTRGLGMEGNEQIVQAYGVREIATGIGILSSNQPAPWIWGRVGGDALDIATLAAGLQQDNPKKDNVELAIVAVAGVTALDVVCGTSLARRLSPRVAAVRRSTIIAGLASQNPLTRCGERHETSRFPATCEPRRRCGLSRPFRSGVIEMDDLDRRRRRRKSLAKRRAALGRCRLLRNVGNIERRSRGSSFLLHTA
jgi:hypothetical protein